MLDRVPEPAAPAGSVTLVLTDVQGSSAAWERAPDVMRDALVVHDATIRRVLATHGGYEVRTEGDAFVCAFADPGAAVRFCVEVQEALHEAPWPRRLGELDEAATVDGFRGLRVRIGAHAGAAERRVDPVSGRADYVGPTVGRAARIASAAHGGQVLVSADLWERARSSVDAVTSPLGRHRVGDAVEELWQLLPASLAGRRFPPPRTPDARRTNVPPSAGGADLDALASLRERLSAARLVTVVGPPGAGKTRLCLEAAAAEVDAFNADGGVWAIDLTDARSARDVAAAVANALRLTVRPTASDAEAIAGIGRALASRGRSLLLLDPFDGLVEHAAPTVGAWLRQAPKTRFLVASRERLRVAGEVCHERRPADARLDADRDSIRRSWDRLEPWEQAALASCAVFQGGFTLAAAERVVPLDAWPQAPWLLDVLQLLCDKSLVHAWLPDGGHELRFDLYPAIAAFAAEQLDAMGLRAEVEARHRAWADDEA